MGMNVGGDEGTKKGGARPEMNVTPLVDVVLVLLIIFMVVTPMMHAQFWIHVPNAPDEAEEPSEPPPDGDPPVVVTVTERGAIRINQDVVPDDEFPDRLHRVLAARGDRKIFFDAHDDAPFERAVEALDLARGGGAAHIAVMTEALE